MIPRRNGLGGAYVRVQKGRAMTLYGPFASEREAERANLFRKPTSEMDAAARASNQFAAFANLIGIGVETYSAAEIADLVDQPGSYNHTSVTVLPPESLPVHRSWRGQDLDLTWRLYCR